MCVLMPEVDSGVFLRHSLPEVPGAESHLNLASQLAPRILSLPPEHWGHRQAARPAGHVGAEDLNSGLHTCTASDYPISHLLSHPDAISWRYFVLCWNYDFDSIFTLYLEYRATFALDF